MTKFFRFGLGILLLVPVCPAWAATLTVGQTTVAGAGVTTTIPVTFSPESGENVASAQFDVSFENNAMILETVSAGAASLAAGKDLSYSLPATGTVRIIIAGYNQNIISSGTLANITFTTLAGISLGAHPLVCSSAWLSNATGGSVSVTPVSGAVKSGGALPNVVGLTQSSAQTTLTSKGLVIGTVSQAYSSTVTAGLVISQAPAANTNVAYGSTVNLVVSKGPQPVTVPNVVGMTQSAAGTALLSTNLVTGTVTQEYSSSVAAGLVISQAPAAGQQVLPNSAVALAVSKGPQLISGSIIINGNRTATKSATVTLALNWGGGAGGGVSQMRFSNDGATWFAWEAVAATKLWTLPGSDGYKTVRVQYMDKLQNRSDIFNDYIRLDTVPPTGGILINNGALATTSRYVTLYLSWADTGSGVTRMRFSIDGRNWTPWESRKTARAYTLPSGLGYYTVRAQYSDAAQNYSPIYNDYIKLVTH